jgi:signal transduction histidine kinase
VQQLLTLARLEPEAAEQPMSQVTLARVAEAAVAEQQPFADGKRIDVEVDADPAVAVHGSEDALGILAKNLLDNALRYTPEGGRVEVRVQGIADEAVLEIADDGPGIPPEERDRVFDRFYRGRDVEVPGSGLGLAIAREVAALHGGRLSLLPGLQGRGVTVRLTLPMASGQATGDVARTVGP